MNVNIQIIIKALLLYIYAYALCVPNVHVIYVWYYSSFFSYE